MNLKKIQHVRTPGLALLPLHAARHGAFALPGPACVCTIALTTSQLTALTTDYPTKSLKALMLSYLTFVLLSVLTFFIRMSQFFPL